MGDNKYSFIIAAWEPNPFTRLPMENVDGVFQNSSLDRSMRDGIKQNTILA
jgi:hypothetical protein